jgi:hypothetical protein
VLFNETGFQFTTFAGFYSGRASSNDQYEPIEGSGKANPKLGMKLM